MRLFTINEKIYLQLNYLRKHKILTTVNKHYLPLLNISMDNSIHQHVRNQ